VLLLYLTFENLRNVRLMSIIKEKILSMEYESLFSIELLNKETGEIGLVP
jgi:hypothetical protein